MPNSRTFPRQAIAAALALLLAPASALCQDLQDFTVGDLNYNFQYASDTEVVVCSLANSSATRITIPSTVQYNSQTYRVTSIGHQAFSGCSGLTSVTIPDSVTSIGYQAFSSCYGLTSVTIPDSVTSIGYLAFAGCSGLTSVTIPDSVTSIGGSAFYECSGLTSVTIPDSVTSIGSYAFYDCSGLARVTIPDSVTNIGSYAFSSYSGLNVFSVAGGNPAYQSVSGLLLTKDGKTLLFGVNGDVVIPAGVTSIGDGAFSGCSGLTSVTIPDSVTSIGGSAFRNCSGLASVTIPDSVTSIGSSAFSGCSGLTSVTIPDSVTSIGWSAFSGCSGLTSVTIPDSVTSIGSFAFSGCSGLTSVTIPNSVTSIGERAFSYCSGLTSVTIPDSVTSIGYRAFYNCSGLKMLSVPGAWEGTGMLANAGVPEGCEVVYGVTWRFSVSNGVVTVTGVEPAVGKLTIPKELEGKPVTSIGQAAFSDCTGLTSVTIPDSVTSIGDNAFSGCSGLTSVTIPDSVVSLSATAFDGCDQLWTSWYRTLANLSASGGGSGGGSSQTVSLTVTNVVVHYVTQSVPSDAVTPSTNSTGIVNIIAEVTATKAIAITEDWAKQYPGFEAAFGADFSAALTKETGKRDGAGNPMFVWQDFVAGTDPTDPTSVFTATIALDAVTGDPMISWSPELSPAEAAKRQYTVSAKKRITDPDWIPVDGNAADYNFFRVTVEMR